MLEKVKITKDKNKTLNGFGEAYKKLSLDKQIKTDKQVEKVKQDTFELKYTAYVPTEYKKKEEKNITKQYKKLDPKQKKVLKQEAPKLEKEVKKIHKSQKDQER